MAESRDGRRTFSSCSDHAFLWAKVPLEQVSRHIVVTKDDSRMGWGHAALWSWMGLRLQWHTNFPRIAGSATHPASILTIASGQARVCLHGQHYDGCVHQPGGVCSHRMSPSPPLESSATWATFTFWARSIVHGQLALRSYWPTQTWIMDLMLLATTPHWRIPLRTTCRASDLPLEVSRRERPSPNRGWPTG